MISLQYLQLFSAGRPTTEQKGRELNAPPIEAPRSARVEDTPSRSRLGACSVGLYTMKIRGFLSRTVAEATLNYLLSLHVHKNPLPGHSLQDHFGWIEGPARLANGVGAAIRTDQKNEGAKSTFHWQP